MKNEFWQQTKDFINSTAVYLFFIFGVIFIGFSQASWMAYLLGLIFSPSTSESVKVIIKTVGVSLIGSGVFTTIIKSSEYSEVFSKIIGEIVWSNKFIEKRQDKKEIWSRVSRLIYEEKFPLISDEIENIITSVYFPTTHQFYLEDYDFIVNIIDCDGDENFCKQIETVNFILKPTSVDTIIEHNLSTTIDLPVDRTEDKTYHKLISLSINGVQQSGDFHKQTIDGNILKSTLPLKLKGAKQYKISLVREKVVYKKTNPDKRVLVSSIVKSMKVTVIRKIGMNIGFHQMGTIGQFTKLDDQENISTAISSWEYKGLILPHQGFILIFK